MSSKITINGRVFTGSSIVVTNGKIIVDGKDVTPESREIFINVEGNINSITADACNEIKVDGNCRSIKTVSGHVTVTGNVTGDAASVSGNVKASMVGGKASSVSGNVRISSELPSEGYMEQVFGLAGTPERKAAEVLFLKQLADSIHQQP